jgi:hypothetical protein
MRAVHRILVLLIALSATVGCPDRSMLRPHPDLSKQSDADSEDTSSEGLELEDGGQAGS